MRQWLSSLLPECPALPDVISVGSELATNAIQHSTTGQGGWFDVEVTVQNRQVVRLAVADDGSHSTPVLVDAPGPRTWAWAAHRSGAVGQLLVFRR